MLNCCERLLFHGNRYPNDCVFTQCEYTRLWDLTADRIKRHTARLLPGAPVNIYADKMWTGEDLVNHVQELCRYCCNAERCRCRRR